MRLCRTVRVASVITVSTIFSLLCSVVMVVSSGDGTGAVVHVLHSFQAGVKPSCARPSAVVSCTASSLANVAAFSVALSDCAFTVAICASTVSTASRALAATFSRRSFSEFTAPIFVLRELTSPWWAVLICSITSCAFRNEYSNCPIFAEAAVTSCCACSSAAC